MLFSAETKVIRVGSISDSDVSDKTRLPLKLVYTKYSNVKPVDASRPRYNLMFGHGTGMNKSMWEFHIERLYLLLQTSKWQLSSVIAVDFANHGDSAMLNADKLQSDTFGWHHSARHVITMIQHENSTMGDFVNSGLSRNVYIGHSFGGYVALMAAYYEPDLFHAIVPIEPVCYKNEQGNARYSKVFAKIESLLVDDFATRRDVEKFLTKQSFFRNMDQRCLQPFMKDEIYSVQVGDKIRYRTKASKVNQMKTYRTAAESIPIVMEIMDQIKVRTHHVVGAKATWNLPECVPFVQSKIPASLLTGSVIQGGEHLVNCELPEETVLVISNYLASLANEDETFNSKNGNARFLKM